MLLSISSLFLLSSCATTQENGSVYDPFEPTNRVVFNINEKLDNYIMQPIAKTYQNLPDLLRLGIKNFFSNLGDVVTLVNDLLQLKVEEASNDTLRLAFNSFFGLGGIFDVATEMKIEQNNEGFGDTLGYWGIGPGPYIVLPLFGPSNLRDAPSLAVDAYTHPITHLNNVARRNSLQAINLVDKRAGLLKVTSISDDVSFDPYNFQRDFYQQYRQNSIYDGDPPQEDFEDLSDFE